MGKLYARGVGHGRLLYRVGGKGTRPAVHSLQRRLEAREGTPSPPPLSNPPPPVVAIISCYYCPAVLCVMQVVAVEVVVAVAAEVGRSQVVALAHQWRTVGMPLGRASMVVVVALAQLTAVLSSQPLAWKVMAAGAVGPAPLPLGLLQLALALAQLGWTAWTLVARLDPLQPSPCRA